MVAGEGTPPRPSLGPHRRRHAGLRTSGHRRSEEGPTKPGGRSAPVSRAALGLGSVPGFVSHSDSATAPFLGVFTRFSNRAGSPVVRGTPSPLGGCGRKMLVSGPQAAQGAGGGEPARKSHVPLARAQSPAPVSSRGERGGLCGMCPGHHRPMLAAPPRAPQPVPGLRAGLSSPRSESRGDVGSCT